MVAYVKIFKSKNTLQFELRSNFFLNNKKINKHFEFGLRVNYCYLSLHIFNVPS